MPKELDQVYWVEAAWWRCLRFFADGSLRYCLFAEPEGGLQAVARLASKRLAPEITPRHRRDEEKTHRGAYELKRGLVEATVEVPHGRVGFCLTLTHGARGRGVGLDLDRHSQVEKGGVSFDHRVPEDQRAFAFVAVRRGPRRLLGARVSGPGSHRLHAARRRRGSGVVQRVLLRLPRPSPACNGRRSLPAKPGVGASIYTCR